MARTFGLTIHQILGDPPVKLVRCAMGTMLATRAASILHGKMRHAVLSAPVRWRNLIDDAEEWAKDQHRRFGVVALNANRKTQTQPATRSARSLQNAMNAQTSDTQCVTTRQLIVVIQ